jgi:antitoxin FitA
MPTITLKNIPEDLYANLKEAAAREHRSINSQVIVCIEQALQYQRISPEAVLLRARQLREYTRDHPLTDNQLREARNEGRL